MTMGNSIPETGRLAGLIAAGWQLTYAETGTGAWFADLRDGIRGRVEETGVGSTRAEAGANLDDRLERADREAEAAKSRPAVPAALDGMIAAHLAAGYEVTFSKADPGCTGYWAHVDHQDPEKGCTAGGDTLAEALWNASPLHADGDGELVPPFPGGVSSTHPTDAVAAADEFSREVWDSIHGVEDRVAELEAFRRDDTRVLVKTIAHLVGVAFPDGLPDVPAPQPEAGLTPKG